LFPGPGDGLVEPASWRRFRLWVDGDELSFLVCVSEDEVLDPRGVGIDGAPAAGGLVGVGDVVGAGAFPPVVPAYGGERGRAAFSSPSIRVW